VCGPSSASGRRGRWRRWGRWAVGLTRLRVVHGHGGDVSMRAGAERLVILLCDSKRQITRVASDGGDRAIGRTLRRAEMKPAT